MEFVCLFVCVSTKDSVRPQLFLFSSAVNAKESCSCFVFFPTGPKEEMQHIYNSGSIYILLFVNMGWPAPPLTVLLMSFDNIAIEATVKNRKNKSSALCENKKKKRTSRKNAESRDYPPPHPER